MHGFDPAPPQLPSREDAVVIIVGEHTDLADLADAYCPSPREDPTDDRAERLHPLRLDKGVAFLSNAVSSASFVVNLDVHTSCRRLRSPKGFTSRPQVSLF
jgi:hypothetical protein